MIEDKAYVNVRLVFFPGAWARTIFYMKTEPRSLRDVPNIAKERVE